MLLLSVIFPVIVLVVLMLNHWLLCVKHLGFKLEYLRVVDGASG